MPKKTITQDIINPMAFSVLDIDDDDDLDFMVSGTDASQLVQIETTSVTAMTFKVTWIEDGGVKDVRAIDFADMDSDGDTDVILAGYGTGWVGWMENDGTPFNGPGDLHKIGSIGNPIKVMAADVDGDHDLDILALSSGGAASWWENRGDPFISWEQFSIATNIPTPYGFYAGDFTGDGKADIVTSSATGYYNCQVRLYEAPTEPRTPNWKHNVIASGMQYLRNIWADDMDLDGDLEVLACYGTYGSGSVNYYRNPLPGGNPMSGSWSSVSVGGGMYYNEDVKTIDITDDGYPDVVTTGYYYYSQVNWFENPGGGGSFTKRTIYSGAYDWNIAVGDIGDDGYADIVFNRGSYSGPSSIYWYEEPEDYTQSWIGHSLGGYSGTWALGIADLDGDGLGDIMSTSKSQDEIRGYKINAIYPQNVAVDIGADEPVSDWSKSGQLIGATSFNFKQALQDVIDTEPGSVGKIIDSYGTTLLNIPLEVYSSSLGKVAMEGIEITYNATVTIKQDGSGQALSRVLDRLIPDYVDSDPYTRIYVAVGGESIGHAYISDLSVEYNAIPRMVKPLPDLSVDEDTKKLMAFDLAEHFTDDYTAPEDLSYRITIGGPHADKIRATVVNRQILIDSTITENFYTRSFAPYDITAKIVVQDDGGPNNVPYRILRTAEVPILVNPVNDPPERTGEVLPVLLAEEGKSGYVADLDEYDLFYDVDGDKLNYLLVPQFDDSYESSAEFDIKWVSSNNTLFVSLNENSDWTGDVKVRLYATDESEFNLMANPSVDFVVSVQNVNDGPSWSPIEDQEVVEDTPEPRIIEVSKFVHDIDTPKSELSIILNDYTNRSFVMISLLKGQNNQVFVSFEPKADNYNGGTLVTLSVSDGEYEDMVSFHIDVLPVNDVPTIRIIEPVENGRVEPGFFSVVGESFDIEEVEFVEVNYGGEWYLANGLNNWGITLEAIGTDEIQESIPIIARAYDGYTYAYAYTNLTILPLEDIEDLDFDGDGVPNFLDAFPYDVSEYSDRDGDGVGDFSDDFPDEPQWTKDSDKDGIADEADTHDQDPERWDDQDDDGRNDFLPPAKKGTNEPEEESYTWPILLFVLAGILLAVMVVSLILYIRKRDASRDPRKMAKYYAKQQRMRMARHNLIEKLPLANLGDKVPKMSQTPTPSSLPLPGRPGFGQPNMVRSPPGLPGRPAPALPPRRLQQANPPMQRPPQ
ncbi:MAG: FG-GAP-like repeat-containing protein [Thermoplasmatota archaeon]